MKATQNTLSMMFSGSLLSLAATFTINHFTTSGTFYKNPVFADIFNYSLMLSLLVALPLGFLVIFQCCLRRKESASLRFSSGGGALIAFAFFNLMLYSGLHASNGWQPACVVYALGFVSSMLACIFATSTYFLPHCGDKSCKFCN